MSWDEEILAKFPDQLSELSYIECDEGWRLLIVDMIEKIVAIEAFIDKQSYMPIKFVQIKSKFGELRAYYEGGFFTEDGKYSSVDAISYVIAQAEKFSRTICIHCSKSKEQGKNCEYCKLPRY